MKISVNNLNMTYPKGKKALQDISVNIESPSLIGLLGQNGVEFSRVMLIKTA